MSAGRIDRHVLLVGFMGAGKSTIARKMARMYGITSYDVDTGIARQAGMTIPQIFEKEGEAGFRRRELAYLEFLKGMEPGIVSCGGGIVTSADARAAMHELGLVVFLEVELDEVYRRISSTDSRPLLSQDREKAAALLEERIPLYRDCADVAIDTTGKGPARIAGEIGKILKDRGIM